MHSYGRISEIPPRVLRPCLSRSLQWGAQGTVTRPERGSVWWGFPGGLLRLPRASRSDDFDSPNLCESVGGSIGSDAVGYNHYLKD